MDQVAGNYIGPEGPGQVVAYTGTAGTTDFLPSKATYVALFVTSIAHVHVSKDGRVATTTDLALPASSLVKIPLPNNDGTYKVSAVQSAAGGNLHVCPVAY